MTSDPQPIQPPASLQRQPPAPLPVHPLLGLSVVIVAYIGSQICAGIILSIVAAIHGHTARSVAASVENSAAFQFVFVLVFELTTLAILFGFMRLMQATNRMIGLLRPRLRDFGYTLLAYPPYFVINTIAAFSATALFHLNSNQRQQTGFESATSVSDLILTFISLVILPPLVEEIVMRGFLFSSLKTKLRVIPAALITSVVFACAHLQFGSGAPLLWLAAIDTFILSLVLCFLRQKTGSLWAGIGLHALKNGIAFAALFLYSK